ncbi:CpsD/CapB family tyrosine-protein kinase [Devosia rhodophyticola]|uniref:CpsD/CapB family tyrosine-protein kinase n=1 Tax=Devosia rhodophyticola TaxID=3026423 RepID=A0ABY7YZC0_9HYPH|nr:CpsD/CapB family tyrosine-protein kinase [Devosia rhodophyticola]WDR06234.1 CpsD/CapB family tyrosine-protein kinase [Devosia rhodophyticola]
MISEYRTSSRTELGAQITPLGNNPFSWPKLEPLTVEAKWLEKQRLVSFSRHNPAAVSFDILRTKVLRSARENNWRSLGITAPTSGSGKSTIAANLAISLTKHEKIKVGLVDLDLRRPRIAEMFAHSGRYSTEEFLHGECLIEDFFVRFGDNLAIGASQHASGSNAAEVLHGQSAGQVLKRVQEELGADIVIYNLPALLVGDDCIGLLPRMEATMLVVGAEASTVADIDVCERELETRTNLLGVVLNKCRYKADQNNNFLGT